MFILSNLDKEEQRRSKNRLSPPDQKRQLWNTFLRNHREVITAMDFFTVVFQFERAYLSAICFKGHGILHYEAAGSGSEWGNPKDLIYRLLAQKP
jgi:hypothetical protein